MGHSSRMPAAVILLVLAASPQLTAQLTAQSMAMHNPDHEVARLVAAMLGPTPLVDDLRTLTQEIGGRATGSEANLRSVAWGLARFENAGVSARREAFSMPGLWLERSTAATVRGGGAEFGARVAAMPFSAATPAAGTSAPLLDAGRGTADDLARLGDSARGAFLLVETPPLLDIDGLFAEYGEAYATELRVVEAGALGVVYMSSRAEGILYRHNSTLLGDDARPMLIMERGAARRALDLLRGGAELTLDVVLDLDIGPAYESYNIIGEIAGSASPEEIVLIGAHLDSWDLGGGALDNGANASLIIDVARQMQALGLRPRRTIRFALWNGEEQGLVGSFKYTEDHRDEMDDHVLVMSLDIGCGLINGFFTGGRPEVVPVVDHVLEPVRGLGPFTQFDVPIVGTDNFDFMMNGVANLVGNHEPALYGPNYHAATDQMDQCDVRTLRLNAAIVAAVTYGFATVDIPWDRQSREEIEELVRTTDLEQQMRTFKVWSAWAEGRRGRRP